MATEQILVNTGATLQMTFSAGDADAAPTVTITTGEGDALVTDATTTDAGVGVYTYALDPQSELNALTAVWTGEWSGVEQSITSYYEVVGDYLFSLAELRSFDDQVLADTTAYPDAVLRDTRTRIGDFFEQVCGVSFIPRWGTYTLSGTGGCNLIIPRRRLSALRAVTVDDSVLSDVDLAKVRVNNSGILYRASGWPVGFQNVIVTFEYGFASPPWPIRREAMRLARYESVPNEISDRMLSMSNEIGVVRFAQPGTDYPTGIPAVDAALGRYTEMAGFA